MQQVGSHVGIGFHFTFFDYPEDVTLLPKVDTDVMLCAGIFICGGAVSNYVGHFRKHAHPLGHTQFGKTSLRLFYLVAQQGQYTFSFN